MVDVITAFVPEPARLPLIAPVGEPEIWWTQHPKAEMIFSVGSETITAPGAGNTAVVTIACALPKSFAYVLRELSMQILATDASDWPTSGLTTLRDTNVATQIRVPIPLTSTQVGVSAAFGDAAGIRTYFVEAGIPDKTLLAVKGGANLDVNIKNPVEDGAAATLRFYCRFLQYDLNQGYRTSVNAPVLTR